MQSRFTDHDGVRIHALDSGARDDALAPLVVVPGMGESADEFAWLSDSLPDRRVLIVDVRGRGASDAPALGYTWADHTGDVLSAIASSGIERPVMLGNSRGTAYALGAALRVPGGVRGVVINDYWARHVRIAPDALEMVSSLRVRGRTVAERMDQHVIERIVLESEEIPLWDRLRELDSPLLVVRGGHAGSLVTDAVVAQYRVARPDVEIARIPDRGHDLWSRDPAVYAHVLRPFLERIDDA